MTERRLKAICKRWQRRLRLDHWRIVIKFVSQAELQREHAAPRHTIYGDTRINAEQHRATVRICGETEQTDRQVEETVVHELGHIMLDPLESLANDSGFETGLNQMAAALVEAYHDRNQRGR